MTIASVTDIRAHFPALDRLHNGRPVAYFDAPGGTQVPRVVAEAMSDYLFHHNANTHWLYPTSEETDAIIDRSREAVADFFNAAPQEIAFGANMTTLTFHLGRALGRTWAAGDEVIVTELDHHGNVAPWRALEVDRGIVVRTARMISETAQIDYEHLASLVSSRTKLIAVGAASNAVGTINDLDRVAAIAREAGALLFVDAVHLAPHELIDVRRIGCDFLACSSYKFYGPHAGILFARRELMDALPFPKLDPAPDWSPERVFDVLVPPHGVTLFHEHGHDYIFVPIGASKFRSEKADGTSSELDLKSGEARFTSAPLTHRAVNLAATPFRNITVEILKSAGSPPESPLPTMPGHSVILENDRVRIDRQILDPGQSTGLHTHTLMSLGICVSPARVEYATPGEKTETADLQAGQFNWHSGTRTHSLKNVGKTRFEAIEIEWK